jgi:hypothetical protein
VTPQGTVPTGRRRDERGEGALEAAIFGVAMVTLIMFAVLAGRLGAAKGDVESAARDAARAASLTGTPGQAAGDARARATASLAERNRTCSGGPSVAVDTGNFTAGGTVSVTVSCNVAVADLGFFVGSRNVRATAVEVIDTYRGGA